MRKCSPFSHIPTKSSYSVKDRNNPLTVISFPDDIIVGEQPVGWKEYCTEYWQNVILEKHG